MDRQSNVAHNASMSLIVAVIGPGRLGCDVGLTFARSGDQVLLVGRSLEHADAAWQIRTRELEDRAPSELSEAICRIRPASQEEAMDRADLVFEALPEDLEIKQEAWMALEAQASPSAMFLTGSSALPRSLVAARMQAPERLSNFHPFCPIHRSRVVEVCAAQSEQEHVRSLARRLGLRVVEVPERVGFLASRMALAMGLEAMRLLEGGHTSAEDLDRLMVQGYGLPVGPLELSDRVGLDVRLAIADALFASTNESRWAAPELLRNLVLAGHLGRKSQRGFYSWPRTGATQ